MFVITPELQEFIDDIKRIRRMLSNPRVIGELLAICVCLLSIYFGSVK